MKSHVHTYPAKIVSPQVSVNCMKRELTLHVEEVLCFLRVFPPCAFAAYTSPATHVWTERLLRDDFLRCLFWHNDTKTASRALLLQEKSCRVPVQDHSTRLALFISDEVGVDWSGFVDHFCALALILLLFILVFFGRVSSHCSKHPRIFRRLDCKQPPQIHLATGVKFPEKFSFVSASISWPQNSAFQGGFMRQMTEFKLHTESKLASSWSHVLWNLAGDFCLPAEINRCFCVRHQREFWMHGFVLQSLCWQERFVQLFRTDKANKSIGFFSTNFLTVTRGQNTLDTMWKASTTFWGL